MAQEAAGDSCGAGSVVEGAIEVAAVGNEAVRAALAALIAYLRSGMVGMMLEELAPYSVTEVPYTLNAPIEAPVSLERRPVHSIHSFPDHDRWHRGVVLVEAAEILTWAEKGMPFVEHCRTPLWPNSDRERSAPGLIFLDVRRVGYTKCRDESLRIAWKRPV